MPLSESSEGRKSGSEPASAATQGTGSPSNAVIEKMRRVIETKETAVIGGLSVDFLTARTVVRAYDRLNERKREKFDRLSPKQMVHKAFELDK